MKCTEEEIQKMYGEKTMETELLLKKMTDQASYSCICVSDTSKKPLSVLLSFLQPLYTPR